MTMAVPTTEILEELLLEMKAERFIIIEDNKRFYVQETSTGHIINISSSFKSAKKYLNFVKKGGGFDGWTPKFISNKL